MTDRDLVERAAMRAVQLYAETHPRPTMVTQRQAAEMLGVSQKTVFNYIRSGRLKLNKMGRVPIEEIDALRPASASETAQREDHNLAARVITLEQALSAFLDAVDADDTVHIPTLLAARKKAALALEGK